MMNCKIDLNGMWQLRWNDGQRGDHIERLIGPDADMSRAIPAHVPGEVHLDLVRAGLIAEPTLDLNCLAARWVEQTYWSYRRTFEAPALDEGERAFLTFGELDLAAFVYLNGREVGRHANQFYPCQLEVTEAILPGRNVLVVVVESGVFHAADRPGRSFGMHPDSELSKRN
jgi:beta-mannosidase